jgi:hypothetical protein
MMPRFGPSTSFELLCGVRKRFLQLCSMNEMREILIRLAKAKFPFVVVGGYAAYAHGATLVTQDIDVCCAFTERSLQQLWAAIEDVHPVHRMRPDRLPLEFRPGFSKGLKNLYLDTDAGQLDLQGYVTGIGDYSAVVQRSVEVALDDCSIRLLSLSGIIQAKEAMNRDRDREAVRQLKFIQEKHKE